jgi:hypothetical protein
MLKNNEVPRSLAERGSPQRSGKQQDIQVKANKELKICQSLSQKSK